ncbi:calumenin-B [Caerostris extrusa]|uniref:Reticulocalbin-3 n=1 Tax=Caerostris extrusa TaxID=172846 RepID=A0AAV4PL92_CAEEX|nr:calumenin-B [Caerostris extrusa]
MAQPDKPLQDNHNKQFFTVRSKIEVVPQFLPDDVQTRVLEQASQSSYKQVCLSEDRIPPKKVVLPWLKKQLSTMKFLVLSCLLVAALAEPQSSSTTAAPKASDKPQSIQHQSALKESANQHLDAKKDSAEATSTEEYRQLNADEVKQLLLKVVDENIDKDHNALITADELKEWLKILQEKVIQDNVNRQWAYYHPQTEEVLSWEGYYPEQKQVVSWERYLNYTYPDEALKEGEPTTPEMKEVKDMIRRAERRWKNADVDGDGSLSKEEFRDFIHPEESQRAGGVAVIEAMEDMDKDKNKEVSLEEYMAHLNKVSGEEKEDPNWASAQQGHFTNFLDKDKDGSLNEAEMREWVVPTYDRSEAEAWRLISIADRDQDSQLSRKDIEEYHEYFLTLLPPEYWVQDDPTESSRHDEF